MKGETKSPVKRYQYLDKGKNFKKAEENYIRASVGIQTIVPPKHYISPRNAADHKLSILDFPKLLYVSHTVSFLTLGLVILFSCSVYFTFTSISAFQA